MIQLTSSKDEVKCIESNNKTWLLNRCNWATSMSRSRWLVGGIAVLHLLPWVLRNLDDFPHTNQSFFFNTGCSLVPLSRCFHIVQPKKCIVCSFLISLMGQKRTPQYLEVIWTKASQCHHLKVWLGQQWKLVAKPVRLPLLHSQQEVSELYQILSSDLLQTSSLTPSPDKMFQVPL